MGAYDFTTVHTAAGVLLAGGDPYAVPVYFAGDPLFYPLPTVLLLGLPLAAFPGPIAAAILNGVSAALLAFGLQRRDAWSLWMLLSPSFLFATWIGHLSPFLVAAVLFPILNPLVALKPSIGTALWVYRPNRWAVVGTLGLLAVSLLIQPTWPWGWLRNLRAAHHPVPLLHWWGPLLLVALVSWRDPSARLVAALACVPQIAVFADQLPLLLVAPSRLALLGLILTQWLGVLLFGVALGDGTAGALASCYVPALVVVLWPTLRHWYALLLESA